MCEVQDNCSKSSTSNPISILDFPAKGPKVNCNFILDGQSRLTYLFHIVIKRTLVTLFPNLFFKVENYFEVQTYDLRERALHSF